MPKRSAWTEDDLNVLEGAIDARIDALTGEGLPIGGKAQLAPLFRVREKVLIAQAGRSDKGTAKKSNAPARKVRTQGTLSEATAE